MPLNVPKYIENLVEYNVTTQDIWKVKDNTKIYKLDWNESQHLDEYFKDKFIDIIKNQNGIFNWYPDVASQNLIKKISQTYNIPLFNILTFNGSDVALETLVRTYLQDGDEVIIFNPGYDNFRIYVESCNAKVRYYDFGIENNYFDISHFIHTNNYNKLKLIYLSNPNNPIGYYIPKNEIEKILIQYPNIGLIVDEAYIDFADSKESLIDLIEKYDNIFIIRSFSKSFAIAGLRLGYIVSHQKNLISINKLRNGKNISMIAQLGGLVLLDNIKKINQHIKKTIEAREWFINKYREIGGQCYDSFANFVLLKLKDSEEVITNLKYHGIYIRNRSNYKGLSNTARITISYLEDMKKIVNIIKSSVNENYWKHE